jgi:hypothetical protein
LKKTPSGVFLLQENCGGFLPVVDAVVAGDFEVVGGGEEVRFAFESFEILEVIVDHVVAEDEVLTTAEGYLLPGEEGKVIFQPFQFVLEGIGKFGGGRDVEELVAVVLL